MLEYESRIQPPRSLGLRPSVRLRYPQLQACSSPHGIHRRAAWGNDVHGPGISYMVGSRWPIRSILGGLWPVGTASFTSTCTLSSPCWTGPRGSSRSESKTYELRALTNI